MDNQTTYNNPVQQDPAMPVTAAMPQVDYAARKKKADMLCYISLGLYAASIVSAIVTYVYSAYVNYETQNIIFKILSAFSSVAFEAAWVLVIVARAKFRENRFAKILLWVYIAMAITVAVILIAIIAYCVYTCATCNMPG